MSAMEKGPYLNIAAFCDTVLEGKDGTLSLIRIIDTYAQSAVGPDPPEQMPPFIINSKLVISLKPDEARGRYSIRVRPESPDGRQLPIVEQAFQLEGGVRGVNIILEVQLAVDLEGIYWFDILFVPAKDDEKLLTRVPLRVLYQPQKTAS